MDARRCLRCGGHEKWRIDPYRLPEREAEARGGLMGGTTRTVGITAPMALPVAAAVPKQGRYSVVHVDVGTLCLDICAACGFAELWAKDFEALGESEDGSITKVEATEPATSPYR